MNKKASFEVESKEPIKYGKNKFYAISEGLLCEQKFEICSLHWHNEIEFCLITEGETKFSIDDQEYMFYKNDVIFINKKQIHMRHDTPQYTSSYFGIEVEPNFLGISELDELFVKFIFPIIDGKITVNTLFSGNDKENDFIVQMLTKISNVLEKKEYSYQLLIRAYIYEIIFWIYKNHKYTVSEVKKEPLAIKEIRKIAEYINENFMRDITIDDLSKVSNLSNDHLIRVFSKYVRQTPISYINSVRLHKAAQLLSDPKMSISEIAMTVGINNISYFSKIFKRQYLKSPSEYRSANLNNLN